MSVLSISNLSKSFKNDLLFKDVNLTVHAGEHIALVGENGSGKSTLLKIVSGLEYADTGSVNISNNTVVSYMSQQMNEFVDLDRPVLSPYFIEKYEFKMAELTTKLAEPGAENDSTLLKDYQNLIDDFDRRGGYSYVANLAQALNGLGLKGEILDRPLRTLSGGERMRVLLAEKLLENADLLLLDEPTNHLDIDGLEWLENFINSYRGAVIVISHDRYFIDRFAKRTLEINSKSVISYKGNYSDFLVQKEERDRLQEKTLEALQKERELQEEKTQTLLSHRKMSSYHAREKVVKKLSDQIEDIKARLPDKNKRMSFQFLPTDDNRDDDRVIIRTEDLTFAWDDEEPLFSDLNLNIKISDKKVLVGPNGAGKSTLLNILMGNEENFEGKLRVAGDIKFAHLGQYVVFPNEKLSALEELQERTQLTETDARNLLARYGFVRDDVFKEIRVLSGGEKSRLYLACVLHEEPDLLYLDEPTNHLDIHSREVLENAINDFNGAVVAVSHDRYFIQKCKLDVLGFIDKEIKQYSTYESYRHFSNLATKAAVKVDQPEKAKKTIADKSDKRLINGLRNNKRDLTKKLQKLEKDIELLESQLEELSANLSGGDHEQYQEYANLNAQLEQLNDEYFEKGFELEEITQQLDELVS